MQIHPKVLWAAYILGFEILALALAIGFAMIFYRSSTQIMENKIIEFEAYIHIYLLVQIGIRTLFIRKKKQNQAKKPTNQ